MVLSVSGLAPTSLGLGEVSLSLPAIINREGIARVLPIPLSADERRALEASAEILKRIMLQWTARTGTSIAQRNTWKKWCKGNKYDVGLAAGRRSR